MWVEILNVMHQVFWLTGATGWSLVGLVLVGCGLREWRKLGNRLSDPPTEPVEYIDTSMLIGDRLTKLAEHQRPLASLSIQELLDKSIDARASSQAIEHALCRKFQIERGECSDLNDLIVEAVYDGRRHRELASTYRRHAYGSALVDCPLPIGMN